MIFSKAVIAATLLLLATSLSFAGGGISVSCSGNGSAVASSGGGYASVNCSGQPGPTPSGITVTKKFKLNNYSTLSVFGTYNLLVKQGSENTVTITGDSSHLDENEPSIRDGNLQINGPSNGATPYEIVVLATSLHKVDISGAGNAEIIGHFPSGLSLRISGAVNTTLDVTSEQRILIRRSGAGSVSGAGSADSLEIEASGAGVVNLQNLKTANTSVEISGVVLLSICSSQSAIGTLTGASSATVYCGPAERAISSKGGSSVRYY